MPTGLHSIKMALPIEEIWEFVSKVENWAPLVPGYINHTVLNENQVTWKFKGDLGLMKKKIELIVDIIEWKGPSKVTFDLTGLNEPFTGSGYFLAEAIDPRNTKMTGFLDITASGYKAPIANSLLKTFVPQMAEELAEAIALELKKKH
ncbi:SRPBCC family protein [Peribacillus sp. FSL H8-0477]|uniref:CoxG family protein n=1 Tax=Peribacillus sp. FSL H8-0477 TaxID=2921388 RepID=UPI0030F58672